MRWTGTQPVSLGILRLLGVKIKGGGKRHSLCPTGNWVETPCQTRVGCYRDNLWGFHTDTHTYSQTKTHAWIKSIIPAASDIDRYSQLFVLGLLPLSFEYQPLFFFCQGWVGAVFAPSFTLHRTATAHKLKMKAAFLRWCATTLCRRRISEEYRVCPRWPLSYKKVCLWQLQASHHWPFYHDEPALKQRPSSSGLLIAEV